MRYSLELVDQTIACFHDEPIESDHPIPIPQPGDLVMGPKTEMLKVVGRQMYYWFGRDGLECKATVICSQVEAKRRERSL